MPIEYLSDGLKCMVDYMSVFIQQGTQSSWVEGIGTWFILISNLLWLIIKKETYLVSVGLVRACKSNVHTEQIPS